YYQKDDARALENWQRLNPDRLPAQLAAPLRFQTDPAFRVAQSPATQAVLQKQADRLQDPGLLLPLRQLQAQLGSSNGLTPALRRAENLLPALRQDAPQLLSRLAACFYWSIINHGDPEDIPRYQRVFGAPADDPRFERLSALACEHWGHLDEAH